MERHFALACERATCPKIPMKNTSLPERFESCLRTSNLIAPGEKIAIACSGGPDSVALFHLLLQLRPSWKLKLVLLHLDHGLRGRASAEDRRFVERLARKHRIPVYTHRVESGKLQGPRESLEEAARRARYDFLTKTAHRYRISKIALGHNRDDQAETVLMRLLQGTGPRGLSGIRRRRTEGRVTFIRPLLDFSRTEIRQWLKARKILSRTDQSNHSLRFVRNRIRKRLLPILAREFNPRVVEALARIPGMVAEENELIQHLEDQACRQVIGRQQAGKQFLRRAAFLRLAAPLQFRVLNRALSGLDPRSGLDYEAWQRLRPGLHRRRYRHSLPRDIDLELTSSHMMLYKKY